MTKKAAKKCITTPTYNYFHGKRTAAIHSVLISMTLFKLDERFNKYFTYALHTIRTLAETYPAADMIIYVSGLTEVEKQILNEAAFGHLIIVVVEFVGGTQANYVGFTRTARFMPIFEQLSRTVVVIDVHDDVYEIIRNINAALAELKRTGRKIYLTYWLAEEEECLAAMAWDARITAKVFQPDTHAHTDGGFSVWLPSALRNELATPDVGKRDFADVFRMFVQNYAGYNIGADEMILDTYISDNVEYLGDHPLTILKPHPFTNVKGRFAHTVPDPKTFLAKKYYPLKELTFRIDVREGRRPKQQMYICPGIE